MTVAASQEIDDRGEPISDDVSGEAQVQSGLPTNPESPPDGKIEASRYDWLSEGASNTGNEFALRLTDDGGVAPQFRPSTEDDLTIEFHWRHDSGSDLAYMFNDFDSTASGFRAFTNGIAGDGLYFRNVFGGDDISVSGNFQDGRWYRIRIVLDAAENSFTAYVDGEEVGRSSYGGSGWTAADRFRVMGRESGSSTTCDYDRYVITTDAIHPEDGEVSSQLLHYELEDGSGDTVLNASTVDEALLRIAGKRHQIDDIRSRAIEGLPGEFDEDDIDARAEALIETIEAEFDEYSDAEKTQQREALRRLVATQRVTSKAAQKPQNGVIEQTARVVVSMALARVSDRLSNKLGNTRLDRAKGHIIDTVLESIESFLRQLKRRLSQERQAALEEILYDIEIKYNALLEEYEDYIKPAAARGLREGTESVAALAGIKEALPSEFWDQLRALQEEFVSQVESVLYAAYFMTPDPVSTTGRLYDGFDVDTEFTIRVDLPEFDPGEIDLDGWVPIDEVPNLDGVPDDVYDHVDEFRDWDYPQIWGQDWRQSPDWIDSLEWPRDFELFPEYDDIDLPFDRDDIDIPVDLEWPSDFDISTDDLPGELENIDVELPEDVRDSIEDVVPDELPEGVDLSTDRISVPDNVSFPDGVNVTDRDVRVPDCESVDIVDCEDLDPRNYKPSREGIEDRVPEFDPDIDISSPDVSLSSLETSAEMVSAGSLSSTNQVSAGSGSPRVVPGVPTGTYPTPPEWPELDPNSWRETVVPEWDPTGPIQWPDLPEYELPDEIEVTVDLSEIVDDLPIPEVPHLHYALELEDELRLGATAAGINASINAQTDLLAENLESGTLTEQDPERRRQVTGILEGVIELLTEVVNTTFQITQRILEALDVIELGAIVGILVGALVWAKNPVIGTGLIVFCGKAVVKIEAINKVLNAGQLITGVGYLHTLNYTHDIGARALLQTDLDIDEISRPNGGVGA
ncbi:LamG-like jellyroll fold domain-containing protein [Natrialbaceae archaeon A-gly3]